uniref:rRNA_proc-arch domain-containing protein n=1 Tax=Panagrellus redivivus TaxID=6233 RepID=A0A7E4VPK8_PANRE
MSSYDPDKVKPEVKDEERSADEGEFASPSKVKPEPVSSNDAKAPARRSPVPGPVTSASASPAQDVRKPKPPVPMDVSPGPANPPPNVEMHDGEKKAVSRSKVVTRTVAKGKDGFTHKIMLLDSFAPIEFKKESDADKLNCYTGAVKSALEAFAAGRSVVISSDDVATKGAIINHCRISYNIDEKSVIIVVRNLDVARRRLIQLSNESLAFSMLPADGPIFIDSICYVATIDSFRMQVLRHPDNCTRGLVIFEDVEEIGRPDRGYLWDEVFANLPHGGRYIFSLPFVTNADVFTEWLVFTLRQSVDVVVETPKNAPIRHFLCVEGSLSMMQVLDNKGEFHPEHFPKIVPSLKEAKERWERNEKDRQRHLLANEKSFVRVVRTLFGSMKHPMLVYTTNREEVEVLANHIKTLNLLSTAEVLRMNTQLSAEWKTVPPADRKFSRFDDIQFFLQRGIAIYHAGVAPFILELIDWLLKHGLIKVVIADSTIIERTNHRFQILVINDARVVVDPATTTWIDGGFYRKLINRLDVPVGEIGVSVVIVSRDMTADEGKALFQAPPPSLEPDFVPTFSGVLNLIGRHGAAALHALPYTFYSYYTIKTIDDAKNKLPSLYNDLHQVDITEELKHYEKAKKNLEDLRAELAEKMYIEKYIECFIDVGRLVYVKVDGKDFGWGIIAHKRNTGAANVLIRVTKESAKSADQKLFKPFDPAKPEDIELVIVKVDYKHIWILSSGCLAIPPDLKLPGAKECVCRHLEATITTNYRGDIPELDPIKLEITDRSVLVAYTKKNKAFKDFKFHLNIVKEQLPRLKARDKIQAQIDACQTVIDRGAYDATVAEWQLRYNFLQKNDYINADGSLTLTGAFTSHLLGVADAIFIVLVELLVADFFNDLRRDEIAMVFSVFIPMEAFVPDKYIRYGEDSHKELFSNLRKKIEHGLKRLRESGWTSVDVDEVMKQVNPSMFPFLWHFITRNESFASASVGNTDANLFDGYYATYIQRIDRLIGQVIKYGAGYQLIGKEVVELLQDTRKHLHRGLPIVNQLGSIMTDLY